jgi:hypothetical protein
MLMMSNIQCIQTLALVLTMCVITACENGERTADAADKDGGARVEVDGITYHLPHIIACQQPSQVSMLTIQALIDPNAPEKGMLTISGGGDNITIKFDTSDAGASVTYNTTSPVSFDGKTLDWSGNLTKQTNGESNNVVSGTIHVDC